MLLKNTRNREQAEDILHDAVIKIMRKKHQLKDAKKFKAWFMTIAINTLRNSVRGRKNKHHTQIEEVEFKTESTAEDIRESLEKEEAHRLLVKKSLKLPERQRIAFTYRVIHGLPFKEIAEKMNCKYDTAKANYRHGMLKLRPQLEGEL